MLVQDSGVHTESQSELFIWTTGLDCFNSVNYDWVQVFSYRKYSLLFLPIVGIEPPRDFTQKPFPTQMPYPQRHCRTIQSEFLGFINLMSPSPHGILLSTIISDVFYHSSYCNFLFYLTFLINDSQIVFISILDLLNPAA